MFRNETKHSKAAVFLFLYFLFLFFTKNIFSIWKFTEIYPGRPAAGRPGPGRPAAGRQGLICKKRGKQIADRSLGTGRPAAWRPASQAARLGGGRPPPHPYISCGLPLPLICLAKNPEKRKEREGGRGGVRERQSGEALSDFQTGVFR